MSNTSLCGRVVIMEFNTESQAKEFLRCLIRIRNIDMMGVKKK